MRLAMVSRPMLVHFTSLSVYWFGAILQSSSYRLSNPWQNVPIFCRLKMPGPVICRKRYKSVVIMKHLGLIIIFRFASRSADGFWFDIFFFLCSFLSCGAIFRHFVSVYAGVGRSLRKTQCTFDFTCTTRREDDSNSERKEAWYFVSFHQSIFLIFQLTEALLPKERKTRIYKVVGVQSKAPELNQWQAAWRKTSTVRKPARKIYPLRLAMGTPLFQLRHRSKSGTLPCSVDMMPIRQIKVGQTRGRWLVPCVICGNLFN